MEEVLTQTLTQSLLAKKLGMPRTTVAAALNPKTRNNLRPEVRERVQEAAQQFNYVPNHAARSLMLGKTHTIALITMSSLRHPYVHEIVEELRIALARHGYHTNLDFAYEAADEKAAFTMAASGRYDAVVRLGLAPWSRAGMLTLRNRGLPVIAIQPRPDSDFDTVGTSQLEEGRLSTQHLLERGHRAIAIVAGPLEVEKEGERVQGYRQALREAGVPTSASHVIGFPVDGDVKELWERLKSGRPRPTAVFIFNEELAVRLVHAIRVEGGRVPEDMAVVADGNTWVGRLSEVPMTSIDQNRSEMARLVTARLLERMERRGEPLPPRHMMVEAFLVARESSEKQVS